MLDGAQPASHLARQPRPVVDDQSSDDLALVPSANMQLALSVEAITSLRDDLVGEPDQVVHGRPVVGSQ